MKIIKFYLHIRRNHKDKAFSRRALIPYVFKRFCSIIKNLPIYQEIHFNIFIGQNRETQLQQRHTSGTQTTSCDEQGAYMLIDITQLWTSL